VTSTGAWRSFLLCAIGLLMPTVQNWLLLRPCAPEPSAPYLHAIHMCPTNPVIRSSTVWYVFISSDFCNQVTSGKEDQHYTQSSFTIPALITPPDSIALGRLIMMNAKHHSGKETLAILIPRWWHCLISLLHIFKIKALKGEDGGVLNRSEVEIFSLIRSQHQCVRDSARSYQARRIVGSMQLPRPSLTLGLQIRHRFFTPLFFPL
jgi:hypothetical protein